MWTMPDRKRSYSEWRSRFRRFFDSDRRRLVYEGAQADSDFWDQRWLGEARNWYPDEPPRRSLVVRETRRYLQPGSLVLEGGCGFAADSWNLHRLGYRTLALDYAQKTLQLVRARVPEVRPFAGDVFSLPLADASVDGYWSLGVIEHFYDGYDGIRSEMRRAIRSGGYLFLTFPAMSPLRRIKAGLRLYPQWSDERRDGFYQFGLDSARVAADFSEHGFELVRTAPYLGLTGLFEEMGSVGRGLNRLLSGDSRPIRWLRAALEIAVRPLSYHVRLLVLRRG